MLFKALNNKEEEKTEHSYIYSHTTKHLNFTVKSKRSQSALEYMMTYGWAILIIVIVAVILYSMGIFNPSSSVTFTSSGFSPFTVSSSLCNNLGYKIAIIAGPIPNNANYITINKVFVTSATGANTTTASYALTNPVTLKSGQSTTILIPNVACNSANIHYSLSAKIQYSYTASTLGLQTINTTGTVAGTSITGKPSVLTTYEPITITNTQSSATPNPFQQMVNFTSADPGFSSIATGNFGQNVEFFYYNGTIIPSWLENYTSTNALWWLKIAAIPAGSSETVYVGFAPTLTNLFNTVNDGEAPQIPCGSTPTSSCSNYAEYDDGANVFNNYWNFAGTSVPSGMTSSGTVTIDNGATVAFGGYLTTTATFTYPSNLIADFGFDAPTANAGDAWYQIGYVSQSGGFTYEPSTAIAWNVNDAPPYFVSDISIPPVHTAFPSGTAPAGSFNVGTVYWGSTSSDSGWVNYGSEITQTTDVPSSALYLGINNNQGDGFAPPVPTLYWLRTRAYPPNGVMPSVTFSNIA
jgi:hypothetical protein